MLASAKAYQNAENAKFITSLATSLGTIVLLCIM